MTAKEFNDLENALLNRATNTSQKISSHLFSIYMMQEKINRSNSPELIESYNAVIQAEKLEIQKLLS